jgi:hypothetical protein
MELSRMSEVTFQNFETKLVALKLKKKYIYIILAAPSCNKLPEQLFTCLNSYSVPEFLLNDWLV